MPTTPEMLCVMLWFLGVWLEHVFRPQLTSLHCVRMSDALARPVCLTAVLTMFACSVSF